MLCPRREGFLRVIAKGGSRVPISFALLILLAGSGDALALVTLYPALPAISAHFADIPHAATLVRGLSTIVSLAMVIGAPTAGLLVERLGARKVLLASALLFTVSGLSGFVLNSLWLLLISRAVMGFSQVVLSTTVLTLIATRIIPERRNRWIGIFTSSGALFSFAWVQLAGLATEYSWRYIFLFHLTGIAIFLCAAITLKSGEGQRTEVRDVTEPREKPREGLFFILPLVAIGTAAGAVESTLPVFLPFHLVDIGAGSPYHIAQAVWPVTLGVSISAFMYGYIRRFLSISSAFAVGFFIAGVVLISIGLAQSYFMVLVSVCFLGLGIGFLAPNVFAYASVYGPREHGARYVGIGRGSFFIGLPVAQLLLEPVAEGVSSGMAIVTLGCASLLLMLWPLMRGKHMVGVSG